MALYDKLGVGYDYVRKPDPRIESIFNKALGNAATVLNVGGGTGSYEPSDRLVVAVEPSIKMLRQRTSARSQLVQGQAELLPFRDKVFDAAMASLTIHHWSDQRGGLEELVRIARDRIVIFTWDPAGSEPFWLVQDYFPEFLALDLATFPSMEFFSKYLSIVEIIPVPIPHDCTDGFCGAYWRRPAAFLDDAIQAGISSFGRSDPERVQTGLSRLREDLASGDWLSKHGEIINRQEMDLGYRLLVAQL